MTDTKTKINLLNPPAGGPTPPKQRLGRYKPSLFTMIFALILLLFEVAFLFTFHNNLSHQTEAVQEYQQKLNTQISELQKELVKLKAQKEDQAPPAISMLSKRLEQDNENLIKILKVFSETLPSKAWISQLSQDKDRFWVEGFALDNQLVSDFLNKLKESQQFTNVKLVKSEQLQGKLWAKKFKIACDTQI